MSEKKYILALDQGTTSSRAILIDKNANILGISQKEITQYYPQAGWVEHDPSEIFISQLNVAIDLLKWKNINPSQIECIGITNQRETTILWNKETGVPVYNAIVWQDRRTVPLCEAIAKTSFNQYIHEKTGLVADAYFSASKIKWILDNIPMAKDLARENKLAFGTIDSWLIWNLTKGKSHVIDISNASRTLLFDIQKQTWDKTLLDYFEIPKNILPEIKQSSDFFCVTDSSFFDGKSIPITGVAGDQQASLFGHLCVDKGMTKCTYGTGCFMLMNTGNTIQIPSNGLLATAAWKINDTITYALEGSVFIGGAVMQWLRDNVGMINETEVSAKIANSIADNGGVYFVPAFSGLSTPYWKPDAKGMIYGLTRKTTEKEIIRAALESIAYQVHDALKSMEQNQSLKLSVLSVDGGATNNEFLMQFQANILDIKVLKHPKTEVTALGVGFLAGLYTNFWTYNQIKNMVVDYQEFKPTIDATKRKAWINGWNDAINLLLQK